jgi:outer membrane protein assembly factor BamD (BamD/ComL family)
MFRREIIKVLALLGIMALVGFWSYYSSEQDKKQLELKRQQEITQTAKDYNDGLWYLEKGNFEGAKSRLSRFYDGKYNNEEKYKDAQILAVYAMARYREWEPGV